MIKTLFTETYYHSKVDSEICKAAFDLINKKNESFTEQSWNCKIRTSFNFTDNILNMVELHTLKMNILSHIENYMHLNKQFFNGYLINSWANIYEKNFYQEQHMHLDTCDRYISGVTYLTKNNSDLNLYSKSNRALQNRITPEFADIILFEDDRPHGVSANSNDDLRISIAFNYVLVSEWKGKK